MWVEEVEKSIGGWCHTGRAWAQELIFSGQDLHIDGFEYTLHLSRSNELPVESRNDPDQLPAGLLEANLHIANLKRRQPVDHPHTHRAADRFHERREKLAEAGASMWH